MTSERIFLLDNNIRRRAAISHCLSDSSFHVEPFECLAELLGCFPKGGILLIQDAPDHVEAIVEHMATKGDWSPIICFNDEPEPNQVADAVLAGAVDYLRWPFSAEGLAVAVQRVASRGRASQSTKVRQTVARSRIERLTRREREVLVGVTDGLSNKKIGDQLAISPRTVEIHRANMLSKMGANHTSEAIRIAIESAIIC